jgi:hypothetical protein
MASRKITLHCDVAIKALLCAAIRQYTDAAYPEGGSECAQVARYTLLELAAEIDAGITENNNSVEISKRPKAMMKAALEYYFNVADEKSGSTSEHQRELFDVLFGGDVVTHYELEAAIAADNQG